MIRAAVLLAAILFFPTTLVRPDDGRTAAVKTHDHHPGLGHPEEGEGEHHHGDPDDHHETPESPCHHHDEHTCCSSGPVLALPAAISVLEKAASGRLALLCLEPRLLPSVRELLHVPLA